VESRLAKMENNKEDTTKYTSVEQPRHLSSPHYSQDFRNGPWSSSRWRGSVWRSEPRPMWDPERSWAAFNSLWSVRLVKWIANQVKGLSAGR
jgi:hypothetical protein